MRAWLEQTMMTRVPLMKENEMPEEIAGDRRHLPAFEISFGGPLASAAQVR